MELLVNLLVLLVALLHLYFLVLEMFLWDKPKGMKVFGLTPEKAAVTKVMAANQGVYNGFLSAGLLWGLYQGKAGIDVQVFFLLCVIVAGIYGAMTVGKKNPICAGAASGSGFSLVVFNLYVKAV